ncbi:MAG: nucleotidyltransferase family protein [Pyrinomonadaceae bacterium]|nr:nucleotidyltransferase family protein [Pyrinomonadaceae bacterium]
MKEKLLCYSFFVNDSIRTANSTDPDTLRWNILHSRKDELDLMQAFVIFRRLGTEPVLIKGWAARRNYPQEIHRTYTDIDLALPPCEFDAAEGKWNLLEDRTFNIDLHRGLRHLDSIDWDDLFQNSITIDIDTVPIRILRPEDHLRVLCVHWLTDGGVYKERLWDIYYAVENRPPDFDWNRCLNIVSKTRRRWIVCVIGLAHRYMDLNIDGLPFADEATILPAWFINEVEKEWAYNIPLRPIHTVLRDRKELLRQIRKRFPPNKIQSMIDVEGSIDAPTRIHYQIGSILKRIGPSVKRIIGTLFPSKT